MPVSHFLPQDFRTSTQELGDFGGRSVYHEGSRD